MKTLNCIITLAAFVTFTIGCNRTDTRNVPTQKRDTQRDQAHDHDHDHEHDEHPLGMVTILGMEIEGAQSHGAVEPGKLCHLVVKLPPPHNDGGQTIVRAWIGTEDRDLYMVSRAEYSASHDDYDIHVEAPDPLPADSRWWIEIVRPDGTRGTGSLAILTEVP